MAKSQTTKSYQVKYWVCAILSVLLTIGPMLVYAVIGFINGTEVQKLIMGALFVTAVILTVVNIIFKYHLRSVIWIALIGVYICMQNISTLLIVMAATTIVDEFVVSPLAKRFKNKLTINKEIDKRIP